MNATRSLAQIWGEAIREARTELGLSIKELAERVGIDTGHLSRAERGLAGIGDEYRISIARELGRPVAELFTYPDPTNPEKTCPAAASATGGARSRTRATKEAPRSAARSVAAPEASAPEVKPVTEAGA